MSSRVRYPENRTTKSVSTSLELVRFLSFVPLVRWARLFLFRLTVCLLNLRYCLHRKEVIQPHLPIRLPCYDLTLIINPTFGGVLLAVRLPTSGVANSHGVTGGVYKARERIHRGMLIRDY